MDPRIVKGEGAIDSEFKLTRLRVRNENLAKEGIFDASELVNARIEPQ